MRLFYRLFIFLSTWVSNKSQFHDCINMVSSGYLTVTGHWFKFWLGPSVWTSCPCVGFLHALQPSSPSPQKMLYRFFGASKLFPNGKYDCVILQQTGDLFRV